MQPSDQIRNSQLLQQNASFVASPDSYLSQIKGITLHNCQKSSEHPKVSLICLNSDCKFYLSQTCEKCIFEQNEHNHKINDFVKIEDFLKVIAQDIDKRIHQFQQERTKTAEIDTGHIDEINLISKQFLQLGAEYVDISKNLLLISSEQIDCKPDPFLQQAIEFFDELKQQNFSI